MKRSLNIPKTEVILFKPKSKPLGTNLNLKLCRKRLCPLPLPLQLGILTDDKFNYNTHTNNIVSRFKRSNSILSKLRYYVNKEIMGTIYFAIFRSYLTYVTIVLGQIRIPKKRITVLHKSALSIMIFKTLNSLSSSYFHNTSILKFYDLVKNCFNSNTFSLFA